MNITRKRLFFLAAFAGGFLSRMGIFRSGYTSDDYVWTLATPDSSWHAIHQGRFLGPLVSHMVEFFGFSQVSLQLPLFILSLFVLSALIAKLVDVTLSDGASSWLGIAAATVAASYPYLTSYYLFRMVLLDQILVYAITLLAIHVVTDERRSVWQRLLLGSLIVGFGSGDNQLVFMLYTTCAMAWFTATLFTLINQGRAWLATPDGSATARRLTIAPGTVIAGFIIYAITIKLVHVVTGIPAEDSYSLSIGTGITRIVTTDLQLVLDVLFRGESIIPLYLKITLLAILLTLFFQAARKYWKHALVSILFLFAALSLSVAPMAISSGGHVARIFMCAGFAFALFIALMGNFVERPKFPAVALFVLSGFYCFSGATMFYQQEVLSAWDQKTAWSIYMDVARQFNLTINSEIHLVNGKETYPVGLSTYDVDSYGVNESVLRSDWSYAYPGLFRVATGRNLKVMSGDPNICLGKPIWPRDGSVFEKSKNAIYVCL